MLRITVLNVGHGDSIIVEHIVNGESYYGVIDSNLQRGKAKPRALEYFEQRGVDRLSFIAVTHPHSDHVNGLGTIAQHFAGKVDYVLTYPIPRDQDRLDRFRRLTADEMRAVDEPTRSFFRQLLLLLSEAGKTRFDAMDGLRNEVFLDEFTFGELTVRVILPPPASKDWLFFDLSEGRIQYGGEKQNQLSLAIELCYAGKTVVLGGDASESGWVIRAKRVGSPLNCVAAKLPHHGSSYDCSPRVLDHIYGQTPVADEEQFALISANGTSHPSQEVLDDLFHRGISPYCTGRAKACGGASIPRLVTDNDLDPRLLREINAYAETPVLEGACQGDITLEIQKDGTVIVSPQYATPCGFRKRNSLGL